MNDLYAQTGIRAASASTQYDHSSLCALWVSNDLWTAKTDQVLRMPRLII